MIAQTVLVTTLLSIIIGLLAFIAKKLEKTLDDFKKEIDISSSRHAVSDVLLSHIIHESVNSRSIAEGKAPWPKIFSKKKEKEH